MIWLFLTACEPTSTEEAEPEPDWVLLHAGDDVDRAPQIEGPWVLDGGVWGLVDDAFVRLDQPDEAPHGRGRLDQVTHAGGSRVLALAGDKEEEHWVLFDLSEDPVRVVWEAQDIGWPEVVDDQIYYWRDGETRRFDLTSGREELADPALFSCAEGEIGRCCHVTDFAYATLVDGVTTVVPLTDDLFEPMLIDCVVHPSGTTTVVRHDGAEWWLERRDAGGALLLRDEGGPSERFGPSHDLAPLTQGRVVVGRRSDDSNS